MKREDAIATSLTRPFPEVLMIGESECNRVHPGRQENRTVMMIIMEESECSRIHAG